MVKERWQTQPPYVLSTNVMLWLLLSYGVLLAFSKAWLIWLPWAIAPLALPVFLGPLALWRGGWFRVGMATLAALDLTLLGIIDLLLFFQMMTVNQDQNLLLIGAWGGVSILSWLTLFPRADVTSPLEALLPVRGRHARRLAAAVAVATVVAPLPLLNTSLLHYLLGKPDEKTTLLWIGAAVVYGAVYMLPIWDVLVRGWRPGGESSPVAANQSL